MTISTLPDAALQDSVLVVAHPDDEILWFASVVQQVDKIIICFLEDPNTPGTGDARQRSLDEHPLRDRMHCLQLSETGAFNKASWPLPQISDFGVLLESDIPASARYESQAVALRDALIPLSRNTKNIFTHNPWGEYGHEEHIMVHRIATSLAQQFGADIWHSIYAGSWSQAMMGQYLATSPQEYYQNIVDTQAMEAISQCYRKHGVWTWFDEYAWFPQEFYVRGPLTVVDDADGGWICPVNFLRLPDRSSEPARKERSFFRKIERNLLRIMQRNP